MARSRTSLLSLALAWLPLTAAGQILSDVELSAPGGEQGRFGLELGTTELGLNADVLLREARRGGTSARSSLATTWAPLPRLDLKTVVRYADLNSGAADPAVDTNLVARPDLAFLSRVEASAHRAGDRSRDRLTLRFTEFSTPFDFIGVDRLGVRANVSVEQSSERSLAASNFESTLRFGPAFRIQSALNLDNATGSGLERSALDTRLVYGISFGPVDELVGRFERGLEGSRESLALRFSLPSDEAATPADDGGPFDLTGTALLSETVRADGLASRSVALETGISGAFASALGGRSALNLNVERDLDAAEPLRASLAYDHEWTPARDASVALKFKLPHGTAGESPSMNLAWSARF